MSWAFRRDSGGATLALDRVLGGRHRQAGTAGPTRMNKQHLPAAGWGVGDSLNLQLDWGCLHRASSQGGVIRTKISLFPAQPLPAGQEGGWSLAGPRKYGGPDRRHKSERLIQRATRMSTKLLLAYYFHLTDRKTEAW